MEQFKDMAIITQEEYARLKKIEEAMKSKNKCIFRSAYGIETTVITNDDAVKRLEKKYDDLMNRYNGRVSQNDALNCMIENINNMSVWEFIKWRKS